MPDSFVRDLLVHAIASAKAHENHEARRLLERVLDLTEDPQQKIEAFYWLSMVSDDPKERRECLESILAMDMSDGRARRELAILDGNLTSADIINPDLPPTDLENQPRVIGTSRFMCPQCGGKMVFKPDGKSLVCEYCESRTKPIPSEKAIEESDFFVTLATAKGHSKILATRIFVCKGCSANFLIPPHQLSITCPFCSSPHVVRSEEEKELIPPGGIILFSIDQNQAKFALKNWLTDNLGGQAFRVRPGQGIYIPVWSFDLAGAIDYHFTTVDRNNNRIHLQNGQDYILKNDCLVPATKNISKIIKSQIQNYDLSQMTIYNEAYLSDWPSETYQISVSDASLQARKEILDDLRNNIESQINRGYQDLTVKSDKIRVDSYKLILLPLWITSYIYRNQEYPVSINGQSGIVVGNLPARGISGFIKQITGHL